MKYVYPIILTPAAKGEYIVSVPDFNTNTEGKNLADAIDMAKDAIGQMGCYYQDIKKKIPTPSDINSIKTKKNEIKTLVDIDFDLYRRQHDKRTVRKNCTIQSWLNYEAEKAGINFSAALSEILKQKLGI